MFWRRSGRGDERTALHARALELLRAGTGDPAAQFRDGQWEAIEQLVVNRSRSLVVQRTGWGKSSVYFIATKLLREQGFGPSLLISPLLSLMRNQVLAAERLGVRAVTINSSNTAQWVEVQHQILANEADIILVSPERLANQQFMDEVLDPIAARLSMFIVDEAHCISDWGHDFRPDYRRIVQIIRALPRNVPLLATTATANDRVVEDIREQLGKRLRVSRGSLARTSLRLQTVRIAAPSDRLAWLAASVPALPGSGIIYTLTVRDAEIVAEWLRLHDIRAEAYHARLNGVLREQLEEQLLANRLKVLVATVALGMGFDKPDLGFVVHYQRPGSVVHYYQQIGRAGRALDDAYAILLCGIEDDEIIHYFIKSAFPPEAHARDVLHALDSAANGLTLAALEARINLGRGALEKTLKLLAVESPSPVTKVEARWYSTPVRWRMPHERIAQLTALRQHEQRRMSTFIDSDVCLMQFLREDLNDPGAEPCGRCAVCLGMPLLPTSVAPEQQRLARQFLARRQEPIVPRRRWPADALRSSYGWQGTIDAQLRAEPGMTLSRWGDGAWGDMVKQNKLEEHFFDERLAAALADMVTTRLRPVPFPTWVTCIPSLRQPQMVPQLTAAVAQHLKLPFVPVVRKVRQTRPQKEMENSYQQAHNLAGVFEIDHCLLRSGAVLLIDDIADSGWTFTMVAALLRAAGSGPVFPVALAVTSHS